MIDDIHEQDQPEQTTSNIAEVKEEKIQKEEMEFNSLAILTLWIFPLVISFVHYATAGISWLVTLIAYLVFKILLRSRSIPLLQRLTYWGGRMSFLSMEMHPNHKSISMWWFLLAGSLINTVILGIIISSISTLLPLLLIIYKRKWFIRTMYLVTFLPNRDYVYYNSAEDRQRKAEMKNELSEKEKGYYYFRKPESMTKIVAYLMIFLTPFALILVLLPITYLAVISSGSDVPGNFFSTMLDQGRQFAIIGLIAILPYMVLEMPLIRGQTIYQWTTIKFAPKLIHALSDNQLNIGIFAGEYYIEEDSMMLDMSESTGFFAIFKNGRLFSILVTPLAFISLLFRYILRTIDVENISSASTVDFLGAFVQSVNLFNPQGNDQVAGIIFLGLIIIAPIALSFVLPLIWVISDSELKRATWYYNEIEEGYDYEIDNVENVGKSILNLFKIVLGVGAISALATNITIIIQESSANGWLITVVIVIIGSVLTLPGTFFMAYRYLARGDHARGVNLIRFTGSQKSSIGVGTISRAYKLEYKLIDPPDEIRELLGMGPEDSISNLIEVQPEDVTSDISEH